MIDARRNDKEGRREGKGNGGKSGESRQTDRQRERKYYDSLRPGIMCVAVMGYGLWVWRRGGPFVEDMASSFPCPLTSQPLGQTERDFWSLMVRRNTSRTGGRRDPLW